MVTGLRNYNRTATAAQGSDNPLSTLLADDFALFTDHHINRNLYTSEDAGDSRLIRQVGIELPGPTANHRLQRMPCNMFDGVVFRRLGRYEAEPRTGRIVIGVRHQSPRFPRHIACLVFGTDDRTVEDHRPFYELGLLSASRQCSSSPVAVADDNCRGGANCPEHGRNIAAVARRRVTRSMPAVPHTGQIQCIYRESVFEEGSNEVPPVTVTPISVHEQQRWLVRVRSIPTAVMDVDRI